MKTIQLFVLLMLLVTVTHAKKVALLVETASGYPINSDKDVVLMKKLLHHDFKITTISDEEASSTNIRKALIQMAKELTDDDLFVFYYSGHGDRFTNSTTKEDDHQDDFLVTKDMTCHYNKIDNVIIDDELNYRYAQIKAKKIIIIDACHSETLYKSVATNKATKLLNASSILKSYETCNNRDGLTRNFKVNPKYRMAQPSNMIHLAAALEEQQAEGSPEGGIFTLALEKALKEKGNISFKRLIEEAKNNIKPIATRLGTDGMFTPNLKEEGISSKTLYTKNIFVIPKKDPQDSSLQSYLDSQLGGIDFQIHGDSESFVYEDRIRLKSKVSTNYAHVYLIEMLDKNHFKLLDSKGIDECISLMNSSQKACQYTNFKAMAPFGKSELYLIGTQKALSLNLHAKDSVITSDAFSSEASLKNQLQNQAFGVGSVSFNVMP